MHRCPPTSKAVKGRTASTGGAHTLRSENILRIPLTSLNRIEGCKLRKYRGIPVCLRDPLQTQNDNQWWSATNGEVGQVALGDQRNKEAVKAIANAHCESTMSASDALFIRQDVSVSTIPLPKGSLENLVLRRPLNLRNLKFPSSFSCSFLPQIILFPTILRTTRHRDHIATSHNPSK